MALSKVTDERGGETDVGGQSPQPGGCDHRWAREGGRGGWMDESVVTVRKRVGEADKRCSEAQ